MIIKKTIETQNGEKKMLVMSHVAKVIFIVMKKHVHYFVYYDHSKKYLLGYQKYINNVFLSIYII